MKTLFLSIALLACLLLGACVEKVHQHTPGPNDMYCSYLGKGAGDGSFPVCVYCKNNNSKCGTLSEIEVVETGQRYDLTPVGTHCDTCTGILYVEKQ